MAEFRIDQTGGAGAGVAGQSRFDLVPGVAVTLVATAPVGAGVSYAWEIIDAVNTTGALSALTGTSVTIAAPGITQNSGFRVRLTANDNGNVTTVDRVFGVRSTYAGIRPPLFGEQAPATQKLGSNVPDLSTDNALYANLSGRGAPGQNPFGWREWGWELTQALEQVTDNLANLPPPPVSGNVFVYDSAATPVDNLYNSWAALYADAVLRESSVVIELRSDLTIPAGNYAMPPAIFRSTEFVSPGQAPTLTFDSAILTASSFGFERLDLEVTATTAASPLVCPSGFILLDFVNTNATPPGAAALLDVGPSDGVLVRAHGANIGPGSVFANLGANAVLFLYADDFISFDDGCFTGAASSALYFAANTASAGFGTIPQTMSLFAGTYSPYFLSRASNTFFDNGVVAPPLKGPSIPSIQDALDALKTLAYGNSFVVFSPSNPAPARNVYTTWADLHAAVSLLPWWARRVRVDNTYAVPTVAAGYWDVSFWQFVGPSSMADKLEYDAGGVTFALNTGVGLPLVPTLSFENLWTDYNGTFALIKATTPVEIRAKDAEISVSGAGPFVDSTDVIVVRAKRSFFDSSGAISVFGSMIVTEMHAESTYIGAGCFGGASATVQHDNAGNTVVPQTYLGAPLSDVRNTYAYYMFYDDSVPTLGATNVQDAIDALKTLAMYPTVGPVIWRDGAATQGNVFGSWSALYTYLSAAPAGQREVIVDNTLTTFPQIPAGTWNLSHWKIRGAIEWVPYLQINNGAYFTFDYNAGLTLENLWTNVLATTAPTITKAADSGIFKLTVIGGWIDVSGGTKPFFDGTSGTGNVNITIDNARLVGAQGVDAPDVPVLKFGASVIYNELILDRYADVYNTYALWSTDGNVTTKILSAAVNLPAQANYTSATYVNQELAYQVAYDDTLVNPLLSATDVQGAIDALKGITATTEPTGFATLLPTLTFTAGTRTLDLTGSPTYEVYVQGRKFSFTSDTITWPNSEGIHVFYYTPAGTLTRTSGLSSIASILSSNAIVAIIYWSTTGVIIYQADERHGAVMDGSTHTHLHLSLGTQWITGLALTLTVDGDGSSNTHATTAVSDGVIRDEDLSFAITNGNPQTLSTIAQLPVLYRSRASGAWRMKTADNYPFVYPGTAGYSGTRPAYNEYTGGAWQFTEVPNSEFFLAHIIATNDTRYPVMAVAGTNVYTSVNAARNGALVEASALQVQDLFAEFIVLGTIIFETSNAYSNATKTRARSTADGSTYVDFRTRDAATASPVTVHGNLAGLDADDHTQYILAAGTVTDRAIATFSGTDGRALQNNTPTIDASGNLIVTGAAVRTALGTVALPSVTPIGDNDTGLYSPGANTLALVTGGTEALRLDSSQNATVTGTARATKVGAGVAPALPLHGSTGAVGTAGGVLRLATTSGTIDVFVYSATPEGAITGNVGDLCIDAAAGKLYQKQSGAGTSTGWGLVGSGSGSYRITAGLNYQVANGYTGIDIVVGGFVYQPGADTPIKLEVLGAFPGNFTAYLYDVGSPAGGAAPVLRATLAVTVTNGYGLGVMTLTPKATPSANGEISTSERLYELRINASTTGTFLAGYLKIGNSGS